MHYDVAVVGAGSMGMATGYFLAKQGKKVLLLDAFDPPHSHASHHGETRIIRYAYGEGEQYVPLALRAKTLWEELEQLSGQTLLLKTGVLNVGEPSSLFIQRLIASAERYQLPIEILDAKQVNQRFPGMQLPEKYLGCLESSSGVLKCEVAIQAYRDLALAAGATLCTHHKVSGITLGEQSVAITANDQTFHAEKLVVSVGAWSNDLLAMLGLDLPLKPIRKTFAWFDAPQALYGQDAFPAFSFDTQDGIYYGFPSIDGAGLKIGRHDLGEEQNPNTSMTPFDPHLDSQDLRAILGQHMPSVGEFMVGKTCMYTMTPDEHFVIDRHPRHANVVVASGFSGHGFKFASAIGEAVSQMISGETPRCDLSQFAISRFAAASLNPLNNPPS